LVVVSGFEWDDANILHIARHDFTPEEVEEVLAGGHKVRRGRQNRYLALGQTFDGRLAFVVFERKPSLDFHAKKLDNADVGFTQIE
jgi:hypothetical protein